MSTTQLPVCTLGLSRETLSAWEAALLPEAETRRLAEHVPTCPTCQRALQRLGQIGDALRATPVPGSGELLWQEVRRAQADGGRRRPRRHFVHPLRTVHGFGALAAALLVVVLFSQLLGSHRPLAGVSVSTPQARATTATSTTTPPTPVKLGNMTVARPDLARHVALAYVRGADLLVSTGGKAPRQVAHFDVDTGDTTLFWQLYWSPDRTKLLVGAMSRTRTPWPPVGAWVVDLSAGRVARLPGSAPLPVGCGGFGDGGPGCAWVADRYIEYGIGSVSEPNRTGAYGIYDTQTQAAIPTVLEAQRIQYAQAIRGTDIYFTPYGKPEVDRFDLATNTITQAFALPGPVVSQDGVPGGGWALSQDGRRLVFSPEGGSDGQPQCTAVHCASLVTPAGDVTPILLSPVGDAAVGRGSIAISPDGGTAALLSDAATGQYLTTQPLPGGAVQASEIVVEPQDSTSLIGWATNASGVFLVDYPPNKDPNALMSLQARIYYAAPGTTASPVLVETVTGTGATELAFAVPTPVH